MAELNESLRLAEWLRQNSSGIYRPAAEAADLLTKQAERIVELAKMQDESSDVEASLRDQLAEIQAERDTLRAEVETLKVALRMGAEAEVARAHEIVGLRAEVDRLRADAERYRWLADCNNFYEAICLMANPKLTAHALGEAIDHARTTHKEEG